MSFHRFLDNFIGELARDDFYQGQSFTAYLARPAVERGGDEADIVDLRVTKALIKALGYEDGQIEYNRAGGDGARPDFKVTIPEYPRPCFIVEDKNTAEDRLMKHAQQLEQYMRAHGAPRGVLIDGKRLIAFDIGDAGLTTSSDISLFNIGRAWRGEDMFAQGKRGVDALAEDDKLRLHAFFARYNREAYANSARLVEDLTLTRNGQWHAADGSTWPNQSAIPVVNANENIGAFIANTRNLIREVQLDVEAQLNLRLEEFKDYSSELAVNPDDPNVSLDDSFARELAALEAELAGLGLNQGIIDGMKERLVAQYEHHTLRNISTVLKDSLQAAIQEQRDNSEDADSGPAATATPDLFGAVSAPAAPARRRRRARAGVTTGIETSLARLERVITVHNEQRTRLETEFESALAAQRAYRTWKDKVATLLMRTEDDARLSKEFAAQTAYVLIIRLLMIRIAEDKGILNRMFTNGGLSVWFRDVEPRYLQFAQGRGTDYLLDMAYANAQHVYKHFYSQRELFDWYRPDRNLVIKVLHRLAGYDLQRIDHDLIGHIYSGYVQDEHKHETGMYYTPPEVVEYMLDQIGYSGPKIIGTRLVDLASGSGTFLVAAARRLLEAHRAYWCGQEHEAIPVDQIQFVLNDIRDGVYGLDLNPFACYLAETNLLVQVLDEIKRAFDANEPVSIDKFNIYNTDTLKYDATTQGVTSGTLAFSAEHLPVAEQIKAKAGAFTDGFHFVIGNPPYVRADEGTEGLTEYREAVKNAHPIEDVRDTLRQKWDLFVPFLALGQHLLAPNGRMAMITSDSIEGNAYAKALRDWLTASATVNEVSFFPEVKLFSDAVVHNTITITTNRAPDAAHRTRRFWHDGAPPSVTKSNDMNQLESGELVFRQRISTLTGANSVPLEQICYVSTGMVIHADEKRFPGAFGKDELISATQTSHHPKPFVEGKDIEPYETTTIKYLEFGPGLRAPEQIRRPTFPELYDRPKLIAQRVVGINNPANAQFIIDLGEYGTSPDFLATNEGGIVCLPWCSLAGVKNRTLSRIAEAERKANEELSREFGLYYLAGVLNSDIVNEHIRATRRDRNNIYQGDLSGIPVPRATAEQQQPITQRVQKIHQHSLGFLNLRTAGWAIDLQNRTARMPIGLTGSQGIPLSSAKIRWGFTVHETDRPVTSLTVRDGGLYRGNKLVIEPTGDLNEDALEFLARAFAGLPDGTSYASAEAQGMRVPMDAGDAIALVTQTRAKEQEVVDNISAFHALREQVDELVAALYD